jgi:phage recombination protein Bet
MGKLDLADETHWTRSQVDLIKTQIAPKCSDAELILFAQVCKRTGLDPFARQIYAVTRWDKTAGGEKMSIQTGIDGLRLIAQRTGAYAGSDEPLFDEGLNLYAHQQTDRQRPTTSTVTIWKIVGGQRCSFAGVAHWNEFVQTKKDGQPTPMWAKMPYNMISKCAEAQALRKAFPAETSGLNLQLTPSEDFGGDRTPIDYLQSDLWIRFTAAMQGAESLDQAFKFVNGAYRLLERGELPKIARNSIERELQIVHERLCAQPQTKSVSVSDLGDNPLMKVTPPFIDEFKRRLTGAIAISEIKTVCQWAWQNEGAIADIPTMQKWVSEQIRAKLMGAIDVELTRLGWDAERGRSAMQRLFINKTSRKDLSEVELLAFLEELSHAIVVP